jgi:preprotein translocase subunit SecD
MAVTQHASARRSLLTLFVLVIAMGGLLAGAHQWGTAGFTPKLGLDLQGGTQMILAPKLTGGQSASAEQLSQARDIIVNRVDAGGIAGAEVTTQGGQNIVVSIPGTPSQATLDAIKNASALEFRPVLARTAGSPQPTATPTSSSTPTGTATSGASATATPTGTSASRPSTTSSTASRSRVRTAVTPTPTSTASPTATATPTPTGTAGPTTTTAPKDATDLAWITPAIRAQYDELNCADAASVAKIVGTGAQPPAGEPLVTCDQDGASKYILGPVVVGGDQIANATAGYQTNQTGQVTSTVEIQLTFKSAGSKAYATYSQKMVGLPSPQNEMAATLDSRVIVAPYFQSAILAGQASITGSFTLASAKSLAQQLKFGALPMSFTLETQQQISPTLGSEQLRYGLLAGLVGLVLVVIYSLLQYRALGSVTIVSILVSALMTYLAITILGWSYNYRLDMAGVTGLIVAIGITADSFIVYFERVRDELREGRSLASAVETGWGRAKRTILAADGVNFLAAFVLYVLASANVRGFAFTLGLTTLLDLLIVFLFTHPTVALLARRPFFRDGHSWSGLDPRRLGAKTTRYAGRGRFVPSTPRVATSEGRTS